MALHSSEFQRVVDIQPQWADFDIYGHLNHAVYYALGDTVINEWMRSDASLDSLHSPVIGVVAASQCEFRREHSYPGALTIGVSASRLGTSSVTFNVGFWPSGEHTSARLDPYSVAARGRWRHVYVDRNTRRPTAIPERVRASLTIGPER